MHVQWNWIKQRPHFLAKNLTKYYKVHVFYQKVINFRINNFPKNDKKIEIKPFFSLPFPNLKLFRILNRIMLQLFFKMMIKNINPDYIWITFPTLFEYIPKETNCKIIYDCMDDSVAFDANENIKHQILDLEKNLIDKASIIFVSSTNLALKLEERRKCSEKTFLIRNAFDGVVIDEKNYEINSKTNNYKIGYIGSISSWFDFDIIHFSLNNLKNIEYHLIGPIDPHINPKLLKHERIKLYGAIEHEDLYLYSKKFDCLIMPFKLDELVKSVDPIKIYEYINFNKAILSIYYKEIDQFAPYVYFYSNKDEFLETLKKLNNTGFCRKYSENERLNFLKNNTWNKRTEQIKEIIDSNLKV